MSFNLPPSSRTSNSNFFTDASDNAAKETKKRTLEELSATCESLQVSTKGIASSKKLRFYKNNNNNNNNSFTSDFPDNELSPKHSNKETNNGSLHEFANLDEIMKVNICIKGKKPTTYPISLAMLKQIPIYSSIENFKEFRDKEITWELQEKYKDIFYLYLQSLKSQYYDKAVAESQKQSKELAEKILLQPAILDHFLDLHEQNCGSENAPSYFKKSLIQSCLEDLMGSRLIDYLKWAINPKYPFIKDAWLSALDQLVLQNESEFLKVFKIYDHIFSYVKETKPKDPLEVELIEKAICLLFPTRFPTTQITSDFTEKFCVAWLSLRQNGMPNFQNKDEFYKFLGFRQGRLSDCAEIAIMAILLERNKNASINYLKVLLQKFPKNAAVRFYLGVINVALLEDRAIITNMRNQVPNDPLIDFAAESFKKALELDPNYVDSILRTVFNSKDVITQSEKAELLKPTVDYAPNNFELLFLLGKYEYYNEHWIEAADYLKKALAINSQDITLVRFLLKCLEFTKHFDEAYQILTNLLNESTKNDFLIEYYHNRGQTLLSLTKYQEALEDLNQAVQIALKNRKNDLALKAISERAKANFKLGNINEALQDSLLCVGNKHSQVEHFLLLSLTRNCYIALGQTEEAVKVFARDDKNEINCLLGQYETCLLLNNVKESPIVLDKILNYFNRDTLSDFIENHLLKLDPQNWMALSVKNLLKK